MEIDINLDKVLDVLAAPWSVLYKYNKRIDTLFAQIDYDQTILIATSDYYSQIFDQKNHVFIRVWTTNSPYAILCEGKVSLNKISDNYFCNTDTLLFEWRRKYRPSRYEMGRFLRFLKRAVEKSKNEEVGADIFVTGKLTKINGKFYETVEISEAEWQEKYSLYLLENA